MAVDGLRGENKYIGQQALRATEHDMRQNCVICTCSSPG